MRPCRHIIAAIAVPVLASAGLLTSGPASALDVPEAAGASRSAPVASPSAPAADDPSPDPVEIALEDQDQDGTWTGGTTTGAGVNIIGLTWADAAGEESTGTARLRTRQSSSQAWGEWSDMVVTGTDASTGTDGDLVLDAVDLEVEASPGTQVAAVTLTVWNSPERSADTSPEVALRTDGSRVEGESSSATEHSMAVASPSGPVINTRRQWGADESLRKWSPNYLDGSKGVTIHHTAGTNNYSRSQVPAILRGIYRYHAVTRDWGDVGYNLFVDKYGRAWEGRRGGPETSLRTAHALGMNYTTAGIALVGNYSSTAVPRAAFDGLAQLTSWKLLNHDVSRNATFSHTNEYEGWTRSLSTIHGHRDVNGTTCPGQRFYSRMSEFRSKVRSFNQQARAMQRVSGANRYEVAADLARASHPFGAETVYLVRGDSALEALTVGPAAALQDEALLLTGTGSIPSTTQAALKELRPKRVVLIGGKKRISSAVWYKAAAVTSARVTRIDQPSRYHLAEHMAQRWTSSETVYITSGRQSSDALSGSSAAAHDEAPMLLSQITVLPKTTTRELQRLRPSQVFVLSGPVWIEDSVLSQIRKVAPQANVRRLAGANRFDTSAAIVRARFDDSRRALLTNGWASLDAAAGTQFAHASDSPVLLTRRTCQPRAIAAAANDVDTSLHVLLGGTTSLSDSSATRGCG